MKKIIRAIMSRKEKSKHRMPKLISQDKWYNRKLTYNELKSRWHYLIIRIICTLLFSIIAIIYVALN